MLSFLIVVYGLHKSLAQPNPRASDAHLCPGTYRWPATRDVTAVRFVISKELGFLLTMLTPWPTSAGYLSRLHGGTL
jgi:hypothetical protein